MGKTRGKRSGQKARKRGLQERGGAQEIAALEQVETGERRQKGGIEGTVLEGDKEQGEQHEAAFGSTGGGVPTPILPQGEDEEGEGAKQVSSEQGKQGLQQQQEQQPGSEVSEASEASQASEGETGDKGDKGDNDEMCEMCIGEWMNMMLDRENMGRALYWWRHVWWIERRYEEVIEYDEERRHVHKQGAMDKWINMMANKEMKRGYIKCVINIWRQQSRGHAYRMFCVWIHLGMLDVTLDRCGDKGYIVVEDAEMMEKKWRSIMEQLDIWNMLLGLQWFMATAGGKRLMKDKVDDRIFETRRQILLQELEDLYNN